MDTMHNDEPFYCNACDFCSQDESAMQVHVKEFHEPTHQERVFFNQTRKQTSQNNTKSNFTKSSSSQPSSEMPKSAPTNTGNKLYCEECKRNFNEMDHFTVYMAFYHGTGKSD